VGMVVQSILVPKTVKMESLATGVNAFLAEARLDAVEEFDAYKKYEQQPVEKFERESLSLLKIHPDGAYVMVGTLKDTTEKNVLTISKEQAEKILQVPASPMDAPVAEEPRPNYVVTFRDMFEKELRGFLDVVTGAMSQSAADTKKRKAQVMNALEAFRNFLSIGLDAMGESAAKLDRGPGDAIDRIEKQLEMLSTKIESRKVTDKGGTSMEFFKDQAEFETAVAAIVTKILTEKESAAKEAEAAAQAAATQPTLKEVLDRLEALGTSVSSLTAKQEELGKTLAGDPAGTALPDGSPKKDQGKTPTQSVFAGMLTQRK